MICLTSRESPSPRLLTLLQGKLTANSMLKTCLNRCRQALPEYPLNPAVPPLNRLPRRSPRTRQSRHKALPHHQCHPFRRRACPAYFQVQVSNLPRCLPSSHLEVQPPVHFQRARQSRHKLVIHHQCHHGRRRVCPVCFQVQVSNLPRCLLLVHLKVQPPVHFQPL